MKRPMLPFAFVLAATLVTVAAGPAEQGAFASQGVSAKQARLARAAAEKREQFVWELSDREKAIVAALGKA